MTDTSSGSPSATSFIIARVVEATRLSPSFIRVVFENPDPEGFRSSGVPDEIVQLSFPRHGEGAPPAMTDIDGVVAHHDPDDVRESRNYTVRRWEGTAITIDFVDHGEGVAAAWARTARPGQALGMWGTRSWYRPPARTEWMLLAADLPGVPAMLRLIEQLPAGFPVHAIAEVAHLDDRLSATTDADLRIDWRVSGNGRTPSSVADAVRAFDIPDASGYVWFAGEASVGREIRKYMRNEHRMPGDRLALIGYWRDDREAWLERYVPLSEQLIGEYEEIADGEIGEAEAELHWDEILERAGL